MSKEAIMGSITGFRLMANGTARYQVDVEPHDAKASMTLLAEIDASVAMARLSPTAALEEMQKGLEPKPEPVKKKKPMKGEFGKFAQDLKLKGFCYSPAVQSALGVAKEFGDDFEREGQAWEKLKLALGYESMSQVPPPVLAKWASHNKCYHLLPKGYKPQGGHGE